MELTKQFYILYRIETRPTEMYKGVYDKNYKLILKQFENIEDYEKLEKILDKIENKEIISCLR